MAIKDNVQGVVLALFGASAGGHLAGLTANATAGGLTSLAGDLSASAGLILGKNFSSNAVFRDHFLSGLGITSTNSAYEAAKSWADGALASGISRGEVVATAVSYLAGLTDTASQFYVAATAYRTKVSAAVAWSESAGATVFSVAELQAQQGGSGAAGLTFVLSEATNVVTGTDGNDVISGASGSLQAADMIIDNSSADKDSLNLTYKTADLNSNPAPTIKKIEAINISYDALGTGVFDATNVTGATINVSSPRATFSGDVTVTALGENNLVAGAGVTGTVKATLVSGGQVNIGSAKALDLTADDTGGDTKAGALDVIVNGGNVTFTADLDAAANNTASVVGITATKDTTVTLTPDVALTKLIAAGAGSTTVKLDLDKLGATATVGVSKLTSTKGATLDMVNFTSSTAISLADATTTVLNNHDGQAVSVDVASLTLTVAEKTTGSKTLALALNKDAPTVTLTGQTSSAVTASSAVKTVTKLVYAGDTSLAIGGTTTITALTEGATTDTVKITGTGGVTVTTATTSSLDASGISGGLTVTANTDLAGTITGGAGNDSLTLVNVATNTTVATGAGDDAVSYTKATTGKHTVSLGDGANTLGFDELTTGNTTITGGSGNDAVTYTKATTGNHNLSLGDGVNSTTFTALTTGNTTVAGGAGNDTVTYTAATTGNHNLSLGDGVNSTTFTALTTGNTTVAGGAGNDTVTYTAATTGKHNLSLGDGTNSTTFTALSTGSTTVTGGAGNDTVTYTAATTGNHNLSLGDGVNSLTFTALTTGNSTVTGGEGNDSITYTALTTGKDTVAVGGGSDTLTFTAAFKSAGSTVDMGAGNDTIDIANGTLDSAVATFTLGDGDDTIKLGSTTKVVTDAASKISIVGGAGADTLKLIDASDIGHTNAFDTGYFNLDGVETINITGTSSFDSAILSGKTFNITGATAANDKLKVYTAALVDSVDLTSLTVASTLDLGVVIDVSASTVASNIKGTNAADDVTLSGEGDAVFTYAGKDTVTSAAGNDTISLGDGNDTFVTADTYANNGADVVALGDGVDTIDFTGFDATGAVTGERFFTVSDFNAGTTGDKLKISAAVFDGYDNTIAVKVKDAAYVSLADAPATLTDNFILVDTAANILTVALGTVGGMLAVASDTGNVYYDVDGDFTAGAVIVGQLTITGTLTSANFEIAA